MRLSAAAVLTLVLTLLAASAHAAQATAAKPAPKPTTQAAAQPTPAPQPVAQPATTAPSTAAPSDTTAQPAAAGAEASATSNGGTVRGRHLWATVQRGGPLMIPILICSLVGMAFTIERFVALRQKAVAPRDLTKKVLDAVKGERPAEALELCQKRPSSLARVLAAGLALAGGPHDDVAKAMEEAGDRELWNLDRFAKPLSIIAGVSPLLGLLGTVWGMILAFDVVAQKGALGDPKALAAGIATALLTTLAGLTVAIPCYILYHYFRSRSDRLIIEIEETASHVAAALHGGTSRENPSPTRGE